MAEIVEQAVNPKISPHDISGTVQKPDDDLNYVTHLVDSAIPHYDQALRLRITNRISALVVLPPDPTLPNILRTNPTKESDKLRLYLDRIVKAFDGVESSPDEQDVWKQAINHVLTHGDKAIEKPTYEDQLTAYIMSEISGVPLEYVIEVEDLLKINADCYNIAILQPNKTDYTLLSRTESSIALQLIKSGRENDLKTNITHFSDLDNMVAEVFIGDNVKRVIFIANHLTSFSQLDYNALAHTILDRFPSKTYFLIALVNHSSSTFDSLIANKLIECGLVEVVIRKIEKFPSIDRVQFVNDCVKSGHVKYLFERFDQFPSLDSENIIDMLFEQGETEVIAANLDKWSGIDRLKLAERYMQTGNFVPLVKYIKNFGNIDHEKFALRIIEAGKVEDIFLSDDFLLSPIVVAKLIDLEKYDYIVWSLIQLENPSQFLISVAEIAAAKEDFADSIIEALSNDGASLHLNPSALQKVLEAAVTHYSVAQKLKNLDLKNLGLDDLTSHNILTKAAQTKPPLTGISPDDPYADTRGDINLVTMSRPGTEIHRKGSEISSLLRTADGKEYSTISEFVHIYKDSWVSLQKNLSETMGNSVADQILGTNEIPLTNTMLPVYRRLTADFLAIQLNGQELNGVDDMQRKLLEVSLHDALQRANEEFIKTLQIHVPYYNKLFAEWDVKRMGERVFEEVFLGRDGAYAYIGRRAQLYARLRKLGMLKDSGDQMKFPIYLVYPRGFRDGLTEPVKHAYLSQKLTPNSAHYYDTGYTGTIPEDIMGVLGVSQDEWNKRTRLLTASKRNRTVLGLNSEKTTREQIVSQIEHHVKAEESSEGLYRDGENLLPYAEPTSPAERISFAMVQQALHRYYYTEELRALQARSKEVTLSTHAIQDKFEIRFAIQVENSQQEELISFFDTSNIEEALLNSASIIKMSDPDDPYPDEAVFELLLKDGQSIIVKKIITDKHHGPIDEFEALLLFQRLGINGPRPLARIFTDGQEGYIVMNKLPGVSGRRIKQYFMTNDISPENQRELLNQAKMLMDEIAHKIRQDAGIDKPWRLKDFMIVFDTDENGQPIISKMVPIDFERTSVFDPTKPQSIRIGQDLE